jgi:ureidoacrylate peracid hydrolase
MNCWWIFPVPDKLFGGGTDMPHTVDHREILRRLGHTGHFIEQIDPRRTAHLVIDMQNGFMAEGAPVEVAAARGVVEPINRLSAALRQAGGVNVFVQYTTPAPGDASWSNFEARLGAAATGHRDAFTRGAEGWRLWPGLDVREQDLTVEKRRFSAFVPGASDLHEILQARGIDTVIVTGTMTNCCCESTARDAMQMNYRVIFVPDATAASTDEEHAATLHTIARIFADLYTTDELVERIKLTEPTGA